MNSMLKAVGLKTETTQNTAVALAATDFAHVYDPSFDPDVELIERKYVSPSLDPFSKLPGKKAYDWKLKMDLKTSGIAGTALAPLSALLQLAGMTETLVGGVTSTYAPSSNPATNFYGPGKSATIKSYEGGSASLSGLLHVLAGALGNVKMTFETGKPVILDASGKAIYTVVADAVNPTVTPNSTDPPVVKSATFAIQGYSAIISKLEIDFGNVIAVKDDVNSANSILGYQITGRNPSGSCDPEAVLVATHDFYGKFAAGTLGTFTIVIGSGGGNITTISCPKVQYGKIGRADRSGIYVFNVPLIFSRNAGDDWFTMVQT